MVTRGALSDFVLHRLWRVQHRTREWLRQCRVQFRAQTDNHFLLMVCSLFAGIAGYFHASVEMAVWGVVGVAVVGGGVRWMLVPLLLGVVLAHMANPTPPEPLEGWGELEGTVLSVTPHERGVRLVLAPVRFQGEVRQHEDWVVRATVRGSIPEGLKRYPVRAMVRGRVALRSPKGAIVPGGYDFERRARARKVWASGFFLESPEVVGFDSRPRRWTERWHSFWLGVRLKVVERIQGQLDSTTASFAGAVLVGLRGTMSEENIEVLQRAGLAHILAISGLHMGLVAWGAYALVRFMLALHPRWPLRLDIRLPAAGCAFLAASAYLQLAGAPIPTQRAWIMASVMFFSLMIRRDPLSLRTVALAALVIMVLEPQAVLTLSFQMSFAAVTMIIVVFRELRRREEVRARRAQFKFLRTITIMTMAATLATMPLSLWAFGDFALWSLPANAVAVPVMTWIIMPLGLCGLVLMPFGLEGLPWSGMAWGIALVLDLAHEVAQWPYAWPRAPVPSATAMVLVMAGGLWIVMWRRALRWMGCVPLLVGSLLWIATPLPWLVVDRSGQLMAHHVEGRWYLSEFRRQRFTAQAWRNHYGVSGFLPLPEQGPSLLWTLRCDDYGCRRETPAGAVIVVHDPADLVEECHSAALVIMPTLYAPHGLCDEAKVIHKGTLERHGAAAVYVYNSGDNARLQVRFADKTR